MLVDVWVHEALRLSYFKDRGVCIKDSGPLDGNF